MCAQENKFYWLCINKVFNLDLNVNIFKPVLNRMNTRETSTATIKNMDNNKVYNPKNELWDYPQVEAGN